MYLPGGQDDATLNGLTRLLGEHQVMRSSYSTGRDGQRNTTRHLEEASLAPVAWLRERPTGEALVLVGGLPPMRLAVRPYFNDPDLMTLIEPAVLEVYARAYALIPAARK